MAEIREFLRASVTAGETFAISVNPPVWIAPEREVAVKRAASLGLIALIALALTAFAGAATAAASGFESDSNYTQVTGPSGYGQSLTTSVGTLNCSSFPLTMSVINKRSKTLTATSMGESANCGFWTLKPNGCKFTFNTNVETSPGKFSGTIDIGPAGCAPISTTVYGCKISIGAQSGLAASYENVGLGELAKVNAELNSTAVKYTQEKVANPGCETATYNASWQSFWQLSGYNEAGGPTGLHVVNAKGVFLAGLKSEDESKQPRLQAESYPVSLLGSQGAANELVLTTNTAIKSTTYCSGATFAGEITAVTKELALAPSVSGCTSGGFVASVAMNGCTYVFHVLNAGPPYAGTMDIACPAGKAIEVVGKLAGITKCTTTIGAQSGLEGVALSTVGSGLDRGVQASLNLSGIKYHQQEGSGAGRCTPTGDYANGTLVGKITTYDVLH